MAQVTASSSEITSNVRHEPDRNLALELLRVTEAAAMDGVGVIGEGEKDDAPMLYNGERVGARRERAALLRYTRDALRLAQHIESLITSKALITSKGQCHRMPIIGRTYQHCAARSVLEALTAVTMLVSRSPLGSAGNAYQRVSRDRHR